MEDITDLLRDYNGVIDKLTKAHKLTEEEAISWFNEAAANLKKSDEKDKNKKFYRFYVIEKNSNSCYLIGSYSEISDFVGMIEVSQTKDEIYAAINEGKIIENDKYAFVILIY